MRHEEKIIGRRAVLEAIYAGRRPLRKIIMGRGLKGTTFREIEAEAERHRIPVQEVDRKKLDLIAGTREHQGIIAVAAALKDENLATLLARAQQSREPAFLVLVEGVTDPQNLGAILRTCEGAGVHGVILPDRDIAPVDRATTKSSAGAVEHMFIARVGNLGQAVMRLREEGIRVYAADASEPAQSVYESDFSGPVAVVFGSEEKGISRLVKDRCDARLRIPMRGRIQSLNVSASAAVILYEAVRQRVARAEVSPSTS